MKAPPEAPNKSVWSPEQIEHFILPFWLRHIADQIEETKINLDANALRDAANEIERLRKKCEPEWAPAEDNNLQ
jgi:hypothetical protein